jgi:uncharacterized RDD family membrane protein YckC
MASAEYSVLTPERVSLQYDIAGIGSRGAAVIVDTVIQYLGLLILLVALTSAAVVSSVIQETRGAGGTALVVGLAALLVFLVMFGYFILFEIVWNGQTPGKRLLGLRVIRENGYPIRPVDSVIRNLIRVVDWLPLAYGVGMLTMLLNNRSKRLGDFASGTIVVREGARGTSALRISAAPEPVGIALSNADATLVRDFLIRRGTMNPHARAELAQRLAAAVATRYSLTVSSNPEEFLDRLAG